MTDQSRGNNSGIPPFDPNSQGQDHGPTQGQGQGQYADPTNRGNLAASEIRSGGRSPAQRQGQGEGQYDPTSNFGSKSGGDPYQGTHQSGDPDFDRNDPARSGFDNQTRFSGQDGQGYGQPDQQGQWRQGGQTASDNVPYGGGRDPRQGGQRDQVVGGPEERFETDTYGTATGSGPGSRPEDRDIRGDDVFGGKAPIPERVIGIAEKIVGKATGNARMYEHGQQHKAQGY